MDKHKIIFFKEQIVDLYKEAEYDTTDEWLSGYKYGLWKALGLLDKLLSEETQNDDTLRNP